MNTFNHPSDISNWILSKEASDAGRTLNDHLKSSQQRILNQITKTQNLIQWRLIITFLLSLQTVIFLVPFLFNSSEPRKIGIAVIILINYFDYGLIMLFQKGPHLKETHKFLIYVKNFYQREKNSKTWEFLQDITQYLYKMYSLLFYNRKSLSKDILILEEEIQNQHPEIETKFLKSLHKEMRITYFIGALYIISAILAIILIPEGITTEFTSITFVIISCLYGLLIFFSIKLESTLEQWIKGFFEIRTWSQLINNFTFKINSQQSYCPNCGDPINSGDLYCQKCGNHILSESEDR